LHAVHKITPPIKFTKLRTNQMDWALKFRQSIGVWVLQLAALCGTKKNFSG